MPNHVHGVDIKGNMSLSRPIIVSLVLVLELVTTALVASDAFCCHCIGRARQIAS